MDDLLISLFLFCIGVFMIMVLGKRSGKNTLGTIEAIRIYAVGAFFLCGSVFVLGRCLYHLWCTKGV